MIECNIPHIVLRVIEDNNGLYYYRLLDIIYGKLGISYAMTDIVIDMLIDDGLIEVWGSTYKRKRVFIIQKDIEQKKEQYIMDDIDVIARRMIDNV
jgi:DNA-binding MarR family transcriptional regulator